MEQIPNESTSKPKKVGIIPTDEQSLAKLARTASNKWLTFPNFVIFDFTPNDFKRLVDEYENVLNNRTDAGNMHTSSVNDLKNLNKLINKSLQYVKDYIKEEFGNDAVAAHYGEFGILHVDKKYKFPNDGTARQRSLQFLIQGLTNHNWVERKYGLNFWNPIVADYNRLMDETSTTSGTISVAVQTKESDKETIKRYLRVLVDCIKAYYPDTYEGELRDWGFQKEKY